MKRRGIRIWTNNETGAEIRREFCVIDKNNYQPKPTGTNRAELRRVAKKAIGFCEGDKCNRNGCKGIIKAHKVENCYCHTGNPPCSACTDPRNYCPVCDWKETEN